MTESDRNGAKTKSGDSYGKILKTRLTFQFERWPYLLIMYSLSSQVVIQPTDPILFQIFRVCCMVLCVFFCWFFASGCLASSVLSEDGQVTETFHIIQTINQILLWVFNFHFASLVRCFDLALETMKHFNRRCQIVRLDFFIEDIRS